MLRTAHITLTNVGTDPGPYNIYVIDTTGVTTLVATGISQSTLLTVGYDVIVASNIITVRVESLNPNCSDVVLNLTVPGSARYVYSQVINFTSRAQYNSIIYYCDGVQTDACYGTNQSTIADLVTMFNANPPVQGNACFLDFGTYYDNGDGRIRLEVPIDIYNSYCDGGELTIEVIYD
jgi:hypothetical protein